MVLGFEGSEDSDSRLNSARQEGSGFTVLPLKSFGLLRPRPSMQSSERPKPTIGSLLGAAANGGYVYAQVRTGTQVRDEP